MGILGRVMLLKKSAFLLLFNLLGLAPALAPNLSAQRDPSAVALATKPYIALTGGHSIQDATITVSATWIAGSDYFQGQATPRVKGLGESRIDLRLNRVKHSKIQRIPLSFPGPSPQIGSTASCPLIKQKLQVMARIISSS
jgi:hypothetical protein